MGILQAGAVRLVGGRCHISGPCSHMPTFRRHLRGEASVHDDWSRRPPVRRPRPIGNNGGVVEAFQTEERKMRRLDLRDSYVLAAMLKRGVVARLADLAELVGILRSAHLAPSARSSPGPSRGPHRLPRYEASHCVKRSSIATMRSASH